VFTHSAAAQTLRSYDVSARFNKSALSLDSEALPAFAAERLAARRPPLSIDISVLYGAQQQTRRTPLLLLNDETDRRTPCC